MHLLIANGHLICRGKMQLHTDEQEDGEEMPVCAGVFGGRRDPMLCARRGRDVNCNGKREEKQSSRWQKTTERARWEKKQRAGCSRTRKGSGVGAQTVRPSSVSALCRTSI